MKKTILGALVGLAAVFSSEAAVYTFDPVGAPVFVGPSGSYGSVDTLGNVVNPSLTWNLVGYNSAAEEVLSVEAFFTLFDMTAFGGDAGSETVVVKLDNVVLGSAMNFTAVGLGGDVSVSIAQDGVVQWIVQETSGSSGFVLWDAEFKAVTGPKSQPVPDGGSLMALLGLSVLGLGWASRRVRA